MKWQRKILRDIYGTLIPEDGTRQYRHAYISVAKQNGKSFVFGGLPIFHLLMEDEETPEAYGCAAAKDQASIIFKATTRLISANPELRHRFRVLESTKRILRRDGGGSYAVLSADGDLQDGTPPSLLLRDELHRWTTKRSETLYSVLTKGQVSRGEPLDIAITTAGSEYESPLWFAEYETAKQVLEGSISIRNRYAAIWAADEKRIHSDSEYWKSREARVAANPSHEDLGGFLRDSALADELELALMRPSERARYLRSGRVHLRLDSSLKFRPRRPESSVRRYLCRAWVQARRLEGVMRFRRGAGLSLLQAGLSLRDGVAVVLWRFGVLYQERQSFSCRSKLACAAAPVLGCSR
jgi:phage terminase large subunit-like protein